MADTIALGETWGREARAGWVIGLTGEMGVGKTQLTKGIARGLGLRQAVHSPTFALVNEYATGRLPLFHLDLFRLETVAQFLSAGLEVYLSDPAGVTVVEWFDRYESWVAAQLVPPPGPRLRRVHIQSPHRTATPPHGAAPGNPPTGRPTAAAPREQEPTPNEPACWADQVLEPTRLIRYEDSSA